jgi:hypothetical protein
MKEDNEWRWPTRFEAGRYDQHRVAFLEQIESVPTGRQRVKRRKPVPKVKPAGELRTDHCANFPRGCHRIWAAAACWGLTSKTVCGRKRKLRLVAAPTISKR